MTRADGFFQRTRRLGLLWLPVWLSACSGLPVVEADGLTPVATPPAQWRGSVLPSGSTQGVPSDEALVAWWRGFGDPQLADWVERALRANPGLQQAADAVEQARAQRDVVRAGGAVQLGYSASVRRSQNADQTPVSVWGAGLEARWDPDWWGAQRQADTASEADWAVAQASWGLARVRLAAEVARVYIEWRGQQARWLSTQAALRQQTDSAALGQARVAAGLATRLDGESLQLALSQSRAALPALEAAMQQSQDALAVLTGQMPVAGLERPDPAQGVQIPQPPEQLALRFPADVLRQRPDVQVAEQRVRAAAARLGQARADRYPQWSFSGSLGLSALHAADLIDPAALTRSLLLGLSGSWWDGGAGAAREQVQQSALSQQRWAFEATLLAAVQEVEGVLADLQAVQQRRTHLASAWRSALEIEELTRMRYEAGVVDVRSWLDAQRAAVAAQQALDEAQVAWATGHVRLVQAVGGGWSSDRFSAVPASVDQTGTALGTGADRRTEKEPS